MTAASPNDADDFGARRLLADDSLLAADMEATGLEDAYPRQIAAVDRRGTVFFNEFPASA